MKKSGKIFRSRKGGHLAVRMDIPLDALGQKKLKDILDEEWSKMEPVLLVRISELVRKELINGDLQGKKADAGPEEQGRDESAPAATTDC